MRLSLCQNGFLPQQARSHLIAVPHPFSAPPSSGFFPRVVDIFQIPLFIGFLSWDIVVWNAGWIALMDSGRLSFIIFSIRGWRWPRGVERSSGKAPGVLGIRGEANEQTFCADQMDLNDAALSGREVGISTDTLWLVKYALVSLEPCTQVERQYSSSAHFANRLSEALSFQSFESVPVPPVGVLRSITANSLPFLRATTITIFHYHNACFPCLVERLPPDPALSAIVESGHVLPPFSVLSRGSALGDSRPVIWLRLYQLRGSCQFVPGRFDVDSVVHYREELEYRANLGPGNEMSARIDNQRMGNNRTDTLKLESALPISRLIRAGSIHPASERLARCRAGPMNLVRRWDGGLLLERARSVNMPRRIFLPSYDCQPCWMSSLFDTTSHSPQPTPAPLQYRRRCCVLANKVEDGCISHEEIHHIPDRALGAETARRASAGLGDNICLQRRDVAESQSPCSYTFQTIIVDVDLFAIVADGDGALSEGGYVMARFVHVYVHVRYNQMALALALLSKAFFAFLGLLRPSLLPSSFAMLLFAIHRGSEPEPLALRLGLRCGSEDVVVVTVKVASSRQVHSTLSKAATTVVMRHFNQLQSISPHSSGILINSDYPAQTLNLGRCHAYLEKRRGNGEASPAHAKFQPNFSPSPRTSYLPLVSYTILDFKAHCPKKDQEIVSVLIDAVTYRMFGIDADSIATRTATIVAVHVRSWPWKQDLIKTGLGV
ncbi:uncharacterized protein MYCFIDRAFT_180250 [Pseudocercospora fijiensis CIRAD86]|uniref:Uncharacterized protein n=1 Tax=Pseudocercospora fijiensis (strain CIRAD86) TaxID=383855 RepID=M2YH04_PSEFD|nr:uncharacterized protein MYCFIDRAFT_180250 [Pseudocercospora fijiensis CIRAD86]EME77105.1 hypothetical protein MYCFIDRAFT_180250 [Pseudocercospora fijiensis CIRAD86]